MIDLLPSASGTLIGAILIDCFARPSARSGRLFVRTLPGLWINALLVLLIHGAVLAVSGNPSLALVATLALFATAVIASNAKRGVLGEPLLFSDLALLGAMVKHPQFYFSILARWQQVVGIVASAVLVVFLASLFQPSVTMAIAGTGASVVAWGLLVISLRLEPLASLAAKPDVESDVRDLGLAPTILLYWLRWRTARKALSAASLVNPASRQAAPGKTAESEIVVVVQCESFADPVELFGEEGVELPELERSKRDCVQWGDLMVDGFGAYTMRTEFGVLFGREDDALGFLRYDPYLTALEDPTPALPKKLAAAGWQSVFVHPHDMRFYGRHKILPKAGFDQLVGEGEFTKPDRAVGRYVSDADVAAKILDLAAAASSPTLLYAVTMENHGPWAPHGDANVTSMVDNYNRLVRAGDAMLGQLRGGLTKLGKPATLVFFGDHRPTIPDASVPGGDKHTPYVIVQIGHEANQDPTVDRRHDVTPAQLHGAIMDWATGSAEV